MYDPLDKRDIESELSYAYLHAVASAKGINCQPLNRHADNRCRDALLTCYEHFEGSYKEEIDLKVQLKATIHEPSNSESHLSYFFKGLNQYDFLRQETKGQYRLLIVLFLPSNKEEWLNVSPDQLILKNCAYWVSLRGAGASENLTGTTVYLPKKQTLTPDNLLSIFEKLSRNDSLNYLLP
ncbi:MAG: DUF4365 domain-containing protein [Methylococcales bacterium]